MATTEDRIQAAGAPPRKESTGVHVRPAGPPDLSAIAEIEAGSFSNPWHPDTFRSLLKQERAMILVAEDSVHGVVGYTVLWWVLDQAELANIAVRKDHQNRGIGSILLDSALAHAEDKGVETIFLEVRVSNETAYRLYSNRGFSQISVRRDYYQKPREDARILAKHL